MPVLATLQVSSQMPLIEEAEKASGNTYLDLQSQHLHEMANLLLSLSQHYDQSYMLFKSETTLPPEEREELAEVVEHDDEQLDDVISEMSERIIELEDLQATIYNHLTAAKRVRANTIAVFANLEACNIKQYLGSLESFAKVRAKTGERLDFLKQQLSRLAYQYILFQRSYDALILEIDRRARYEASLAAFISNTTATMDRLQDEEHQKRDQFLLEHGETLPSDIWLGANDLPAQYVLSLSNASANIPCLSDSVVAMAKARHNMFIRSIQ